MATFIAKYDATRKSFKVLQNKIAPIDLENVH